MLRGLIAIAAIVVIYAAYQFAQPASAVANTYALYEGAPVMSDIAVVEATGRVRVSSTFSYISGFSDFCVIVPTLMFTFALVEKRQMSRWTLIAAVAATLAVLPTSGSRSPPLVAAMSLLIIIWSAGLLRSRAGRRALIVAAVVCGAFALVPSESYEGIRSRFALPDTTDRFRD